MKSLRAFVATGRVVDELVPRAKALPLSAGASGLRECTSHARSRAASKDSPPNLLLLTPEQRANVEAKAKFRKRVEAVLGPDQSVAEQALFFGEKRTKYHERIRWKRTDLAPLDAWSTKLDDYEEFLRLAAEFLRTA